MSGSRTVVFVVAACYIQVAGASDARAQDSIATKSVLLSPGTIDGLRLKPTKRLLTIEWVGYGSSEGATSIYRSSSVEQLRRDGSILLRITTVRSNGPTRGDTAAPLDTATGTDSAAYDARTLMPLWDHRRIRGAFLGFHIRGAHVLWFDEAPDAPRESYDSTFADSAFLERSVGLVLEAAASLFEPGKAFWVPVIDFDQYNSRLVAYKELVRILGVDTLPASASLPSREVWVLKVHDDTY